MQSKLEKRKIIATEIVALPTIMFFIVLFSAYMLTTYLGYTDQLPLKYCVLINSLLAYFLFTPMHEATHGSISGRNKRMKPVETLIGYLSGIPLFAPFPILKLQHLKHHANTNHPYKDPDFYIHSSSLPMALIKSVVVFIVAYFNVLKLKSLENKKLMRNTIFFNMLFNIVFIFLGIKFGFKYPLLTWALPGIIGLSILSIVFAWIPHHPHEEQGKYRSSRIIQGTLLKYFTACQSYHLIHHLYPKIPFYQYKKAYNYLEEELKHNDAIII
ncbi:hypothetical protein A9Q84_16345 [Halobacteriovorax marinus]|uniref:Fatty acid desaturase domain-containing protein n=1 Tax=Halobacteriovorax marinus TaxID=97084 RepID=A0A1Y5F4A0_9BACT|nr:hypothetical protein A9Q84_16345 [Halobacteriovorax marinus]